MSIQNPQIQSHAFLQKMYDDDYYPTGLVDECKAIFLNACERIEQEKPQNLDELYAITHEATEQLNQFEDDLETVARECLAETMEFIAQVYGFEDADGEELIAPRYW